MKGMRSVLVAAALCLVVISLFAAPAYAWGLNTPNAWCSNRYPCPAPYSYRYVNPYPVQPAYRQPYAYQYQYNYRQPQPYQYQYAKPQPYQYQYTNPQPQPYQYQYQYQYTAPAPPPPPPYPGYYSAPGLSTAYGDYTLCQQYGVHQANCFVPDASNSPNLGSIQMEPGIAIWGSCSSGQSMNQSGTNYQCSKTGAGWFPQ